jgi:hypothetical protein
MTDGTRSHNSANPQNAIACSGKIRFTDSLPKTRDREPLVAIAYSKAVIYTHPWEYSKSITKLGFCQIYTWREIVKTWLKDGALSCWVRQYSAD